MGVFKRNKNNQDEVDYSEIILPKMRFYTEDDDCVTMEMPVEDLKIGTVNVVRSIVFHSSSKIIS